MFPVRHVLTALLLCLAPLLQAQGPPEAAPGITLPHSGTVFVLDHAGGSPVLTQLHPTEIVSNSHAGGNFARGLVYSGPRMSVEVAGLNASVNCRNAELVFFVRLTGDDPELLRNRVKLIRLQQKQERRVVSTYSQNVFGGQRTKRQDEVPVTKTDVSDSQWLKVKPDAPLAPGEYAIVFMPKDTNLFADSIYDFDVAIDQAKPEK